MMMGLQTVSTATLNDKRSSSIPENVTFRILESIFKARPVSVIVYLQASDKNQCIKTIIRMKLDLEMINL